MHSKDDPLQQSGPQRKVTLWIEREGMQEARENYWNAFVAADPGMDHSRYMEVWNIAFAAAVAAIDYVMAGRITP